MAYGSLGSMRTTPGARGQVIEILLRDVAALADVGCLAYIVSTSTTDDDAIWIFESWTSAEAHQASLQLPTVRAAISAAMPMLTGEFTGQQVEVVGGLGVA